MKCKHCYTNKNVTKIDVKIKGHNMRMTLCDRCADHTIRIMNQIREQEKTTHDLRTP